MAKKNTPKWLSADRRSPSGKNANKGDPRTEFDRDLGRILHSSSFRRLQGKTQVWGVSESDFFRTRLTHSLEAAQIGKTLADALKISGALVMTSCLAHDIGHPPFGHDGAEVLNDFAQNISEGNVFFDDNAQNLRIVTRIENAYAPSSGLNLTAAALDGMIKYKRPANSDGKAGYYKEDEEYFHWITATTGTEKLRSPIVMLVELADDIAYACHDFEDAMRAGFVGINHLSAALEEANTEETKSEYKFLDLIAEKLQSFSNGRPDDPEHFRSAQKRLKSFLVNRFVMEAIHLKPKIERKLHTGDYDAGLKTNLFFDSSPSLKREVDILKSLIKKHVIFNSNVQLARFASITMLKGYISNYKELFTWNLNDDCHAFRSLPRAVQDKLRAAPDRGARLQAFLDYVSGMTDTYLLRQATLFLNPSQIHSLVMPM